MLSIVYDMQNPQPYLILPATTERLCRPQVATILRINPHGPSPPFAALPLSIHVSAQHDPPLLGCQSTFSSFVIPIAHWLQQSHALW